MNQHQHTADVLNRAADHICMFGHTKGVAFGPGPLETAPVCSHGAISVACMTAYGINAELALAARVVLREHIGSLGVARWNDAEERTAEEVVEALRAAAVIELSKAETLAPVTA